MKIVFEVPDGDVERVMEVVAREGFDVREYYGDRWPRPVRGVLLGCTRVGAERPRQSFARDEEDAVLAAFEAVQAQHQLAVTIVSVETWEAGGDGDDGLPGVPEPRQPGPRDDLPQFLARLIESDEDFREAWTGTVRRANTTSVLLRPDADSLVKTRLESVIAEAGLADQVILGEGSGLIYGRSQ